MVAVVLKLKPSYIDVTVIFSFAVVFPQVRLAAELLGTCMLNVRLADNSVYGETIDQVLQSFIVVVKNLKSLAQLALKQPQVLSRS